jgi:polar amino acid transport system permease protein
MYEGKQMLNLFDISVVYSDFWGILKFLPTTLELTVVSMIGGLVLGFLLAILKMKRIPVINQLIALFISLLRGTPIIVQLYVTYFGIPIALKYYNYYAGTDYNTAGIPAILFAFVALSLNTAAYNAVTVQSALEAVNKGEIEAAAALGMTGFQRMRRIIIPEAVELALPSLGNTLIGLVKGTSLAFSCAVVEMTAQAKIIGGRDYRYFEAYVALSIIYWLVVIVMEQVMRVIIKSVQVPDVAGEGK